MGNDLTQKTSEELFANINTEKTRLFKEAEQAGEAYARAKAAITTYDQATSMCKEIEKLLGGSSRLEFLTSVLAEAHSLKDYNAFVRAGLRAEALRHIRGCIAKCDENGNLVVGDDVMDLNTFAEKAYKYTKCKYSQWVEFPKWHIVPSEGKRLVRDLVERAMRLILEAEGA